MYKYIQKVRNTNAHGCGLMKIANRSDGTEKTVTFMTFVPAT